MNNDVKLDFLTDDENETFIHFVELLLQNRSPRYLEFRGSPWSIETDALVYIDERGCDTAWIEGSEIVLGKHLTESEIEHMDKNGYIVKDKKIFAYSRFLMEYFIKAAVLIKGADKRYENTRGMLVRLIDKVNGVCDGKPVDGEIVTDQIENQNETGPEGAR